MTSHDVVGRVRRALSERRVGHAGTLDPAASGVLVVGVGQATRLLGLLTLDDKRYIARIRFGASTDTDDAEGKVLEMAPVPDELSVRAYASKALEGILGPQDQVPPAYSAISLDGKRAYALARAGKDVNLEPRHITVHEAELVAIDPCEDGLAWTCIFKVSKGTYIRSLARDLGKRLGAPAHLEALERISAGPVTLSDCLSLDELAASDVATIAGRSLDPLALVGIEPRVLSAEELGRSINGSSLDACGLAEGTRVGLVHDNRLMGLWKVAQGRLRCESNFPGGIGGVCL